MRGGGRPGAGQESVRISAGGFADELVPFAGAVVELADQVVAFGGEFSEGFVLGGDGLVAGGEVGAEFFGGGGVGGGDGSELSVSVGEGVGGFLLECGEACDFGFEGGEAGVGFSGGGLEVGDLAGGFGGLGEGGGADGGFAEPLCDAEGGEGQGAADEEWFHGLGGAGAAGAAGAGRTLMAYWRKPARRTESRRATMAPWRAFSSPLM